MTKLVTDLAPAILAEIKQSTHVLLHCHPGPDPDSVGSVLAVAGALRQLGKRVTMIAGDSDFPPTFKHLPGADQILDHNYGEADLSEVDLFLILDSGAIGQVSKLGEVIFPPTMRTVVIDHHITNPGFAQINLIDSAYPATCQILADLFTLWQVEITHDIAVNLLMGIYADTGGFKYSGTTADTFATAAKLTALAPDFSKYIFELENNNTPSMLKFQAIALSKIEVVGAGHVAIIAIDYDVLAKLDISRDDAQGSLMAGKLRSVAGWDIGACIIEKEPGISLISFRSRDPQAYDVSKIAASLGGGGHPAAAGLRLECNTAEARGKILTAIGKIYPSLV